MACCRRVSHSYGRVILSVGNIHIKCGVSDTREGRVMTNEIQKFEKYHEIRSIYSRTRHGLHIGVSWYGWSLCVSSLKYPRL